MLIIKAGYKFVMLLKKLMIDVRWFDVVFFVSLVPTIKDKGSVKTRIKVAVENLNNIYMLARVIK